MGNLGGGEILVILLAALIFLGPEKLPEVARQIGKVVGEVRRVSAGFQREVQDAMRMVEDTVNAAPAIEPPGNAPAASAAPSASTGQTGPDGEPSRDADDAAVPGTAASPVAGPPSAEPPLPTPAEPPAPTPVAPSPAADVAHGGDR